jgi:hypothetical protein
VRCVQIFCGIIIENVLLAGQSFGIDYPANGKRLLAITPDQGSEPPISFTSLRDVARTIVAVAATPYIASSQDDIIRISGDVSTWSKVAKLTGSTIRSKTLSTFQAQYLDRDSTIETFLRISAARGILHFPAPPQRRREWTLPINDNDLIDAYSRQRWEKVSSLAKTFEKYGI